MIVTLPPSDPGSPDGRPLLLNLENARMVDGLRVVWADGTASKLTGDQADTQVRVFARRHPASPPPPPPAVPAAVAEAEVAQLDAEVAAIRARVEARQHQQAEGSPDPRTVAEIRATPAGGTFPPPGVVDGAAWRQPGDAE